ncbi:50S ribosomal protein L3 [Candidatus Saccharibacteria bacterium]|nr:50S ribosomal protein L3 [Candidatus Saccharibacteria bacterium]
MKALITRKLGMTSILDEKGAATPVTLLSASPNVVTQLKNTDTDGYRALQLGFETNKRPAKPQAGHFKASKQSPKIVREFRITGDEEIEKDVGDQLAADSFEVGDIVSVTGVSKGKGFAGTIKRHNFHRGRKTHGGRSYRRPGSIGSMFPQRIFPGKKMAGQMGHEQVTTKNLSVAIIDTDLQVIGVKGAVPGPRKGIVLIKGTKS